MAGGGFIKLAIMISAHQRGFAAFERAGRGMRGLGAAAARVGLEFALLGGMIATEFAAAAIRAFAEFEHAMAKVQAVAKATTSEIGELREEALRLARTTMFTATEVGSAMFFLSQAGLNTAKIMKAIPSVLDLAKVGMINLGTASDIVTDIMAGLGIQTEDLAHVTDVLVETYSSYNTTVEQLGTAFSYVGPIARQLGVEVEILSASIGILSSSGIKGERAGTALRNILIKLINPSIEAQRVMGELGVTVFDSAGNFLGLVEILRQFRDAGASAADVMQIFQMRAGPAFSALMENIEGSEKALLEFSDTLASVATEGAAARAGAIIEESPQVKIDKFKARIQEFLIMAGEELFPVLEELFALLFDDEGKSTAFMDSLLELVKALVPLIISLIPTLTFIAWILSKVFAAAAAFMPLLEIVAVVLMVIAAIAIGLSAPFWAIAFAIGAIITAIAIVLQGMKDIDSYKERWSKGWGKFYGWWDDATDRLVGKQSGGKIDRTGMYMLHAGEEVLNPRLGQNTSSGIDQKERRGNGVVINNTYNVMSPATAIIQERENRKSIRRFGYR